MKGDRDASEHHPLGIMFSKTCICILTFIIITSPQIYPYPPTPLHYLHHLNHDVHHVLGLYPSSQLSSNHHQKHRNYLKHYDDQVLDVCEGGEGELFPEGGQGRDCEKAKICFWLHLKGTLS